VTGGQTYTIETIIGNPLSAAGYWTVTTMVNGYQAITYTFTSGDTEGNSATQLSGTEERYTQGGFGLYDDTSSVISYFAVMPN
jgi:hypothetical protein